MITQIHRKNGSSQSSLIHMTVVSPRLQKSKEAWLNNETSCRHQRKFDWSASKEPCKRHWQHSMIQSTEDPIQQGPIRYSLNLWNLPLIEMADEMEGRGEYEWWVHKWKGRSDDPTFMKYKWHDSGQVLSNLWRHIWCSWLRLWRIQADTLRGYSAG